MIYKYIIIAKSNTSKKSKKLGLNPYDIHDNINIKIKEPLTNISKGRFILMFDPNKNEIIVAEGEEKY